MKNIINDDCIAAMREMPENSVTAIITDPPYGLEFMGKEWDRGVPGVPFWAGALRVLKPGGHALIFGGTRTFHRLACAVEDAGFEIRDCLSWMYGTGFPKSHDVSKAIDKAAGAERDVIGVRSSYRPAANASRDPKGFQDRSSGSITAPSTDEAKRWTGYGTALKPAWEPIILARKPFKGTVASNALEHGTGALNIDGCRVETDEDLNGGAYAKQGNRSESPSLRVGSGMNVPGKTTGKDFEQPSGRWPANVVLDEEAAEMLDEPSRFFYCAKASKKDRGEGNNHPTVKPVELMRWLVRLVTGPDPETNLILDPFAGSGTTGVAAQIEGIPFVLVEQNPEYVEIIKNRLS